MRKILALLLILALALPLLYAALTLFSVSGWALNRSFYQGILAEQSLYDTLLAEARARKDLPWDVGRWAPPASSGLPAGLPPEALAKALAQTVSAGYLREQALAALNGVFDAAGGRPADLEVDLRPLKRDLGGPSRRAFADALAEALPPCRTGQDPLAPGSRLLACRPSGMTVPRASQLVYDGLPAALQQVADRYPYAEAADFPLWVGPLDQARLLWAAVVLALIAAGFWVGAAFLGGRNRAQVTAFLGWSLFPPALLTLAAGAALRLGAVWLPRLGIWLPYGGLWPSPELTRTLADTLRPAVNAVSRGFLITGAVALGLSLSLIVWWGTLRRER